MHPDEPPVLRDRVHAALTAQATPLTVQQLAAALLPTNHPSAAPQIARALRQLEHQGAAVRERGKPWAGPDYWRAASPGPQTSR